MALDLSFSPVVLYSIWHTVLHLKKIDPWRCGKRWDHPSAGFTNRTARKEHHYVFITPPFTHYVVFMTFKLKMRYKKTLSTVSGPCCPSFAQCLVEVCLDGIQEVCGVDVMLIQLTAVVTERQMLITLARANITIDVSSFIIRASHLMEITDIILWSFFICSE